MVKMDLEVNKNPLTGNSLPQGTKKALRQVRRAIHAQGNKTV
jgi:hypothetical protein